MKLKDASVLVTGASSGLGRAIAERLASQEGANLVLTARRSDLLEGLARELSSEFSRKVEVVPADLTDPQSIDQVVGLARRRNVRVVVLNAGITYYGRHVEMPEEQLLQIIDTNIRGSMMLLHRLLGTSRPNALTAILIIASGAGLVPVPYQAAYSGSKAFLVSFGQALGAELAESGISVTVVAPAGIATEMLEVSGLSAKFSARHPGVMSSERAAAMAVQALLRRRSLVVPGLSGKLGVGASRLLPRRVILRLMKRLYEPP